MDKQLKSQVVFHVTGRHAEGGTAADAVRGMQPALMAPFRRLEGLRYDFPVVLAADGTTPVRSLTAEGSVVSRQITKAEAGNVTLFAFDKDQELSEHTAPFDALVHVLDGETEIKISGKPFLLKSGDAIIMPANEPPRRESPDPLQDAVDGDPHVGAALRLRSASARSAQDDVLATTSNS